MAFLKVTDIRIGKEFIINTDKIHVILKIDDGGSKGCYRVMCPPGGEYVFNEKEIMKIFNEIGISI